MRSKLTTLLLSVAGGTVFQLLHIPLAWMLGPMTAVMLWQEVFKKKASWPVGLRNAGLVPLGYTMGIPFTAEVAVRILYQLPSMLAATMLTVLFGCLLGLLAAKRSGLTLATGLLGGIPGGLTQMVVLSDEIADSDATVVTFMQTVRLISVLFIVPFLAVHGLAGGAAAAKGAAAAAGAADTAPPLVSLSAVWFVLAVGLMTWLAPRLKLPTPYMLGPLIGVAALAVCGLQAPNLPQSAIIVAQLAVGAHMGVTTRLSSLANWKKLLPYSLLSGIGIVLFSLVIGWFLKLLTPMSFVTAFLATAPGGMTEMGLTGAAVHADLTVIVSYQMFRILFILFAVPPLLRWWLAGRTGRRVKRPVRAERAGPQLSAKRDPSS